MNPSLESSGPTVQKIFRNVENMTDRDLETLAEFAEVLGKKNRSERGRDTGMAKDRLRLQAAIDGVTVCSVFDRESSSHRSCCHRYKDGHRRREVRLGGVLWLPRQIWRFLRHCILIRLEPSKSGEIYCGADELGEYFLEGHAE